MNINFINPLRCPNCKKEQAFAAEVDDPNKTDGCPVCSLASWYKDEPPSSHCSCGTEFEWTGKMMVSTELRAKIDNSRLCENHKDF